MGIFSILFGIIILVLFTGGGWFAAKALAGAQLMGQPMLGFLGITDPKLAYIGLTGVCFIIGMLICLTFVMLGLNYNRMKVLTAEIRKANRKKKTSKSEEE